MDTPKLQILNLLARFIFLGFAIASEQEGSGEVCNVEGSTCPDDKCCRDELCGKEKDSEGLKCCDNPTIDPDRSNPQCANCPKCGTEYSR